MNISLAIVPPEIPIISPTTSLVLELRLGLTEIEMINEGAGIKIDPEYYLNSSGRVKSLSI